jgi:hypothetical protein
VLLTAASGKAEQSDDRGSTVVDGGWLHFNSVVVHDI